MLLQQRPRSILAATAVLLLLVMVACSRVVSVTINEGNQTLAVGEIMQLTVTLIVEGGFRNREVKWASSATDVASVSDNGFVAAHAPGVAEITATSVANRSKSDRMTVTVLEIVGDPYPSISIEKATNGVDADAPPGPFLQ